MNSGCDNIATYGTRLAVKAWAVNRTRRRYLMTKNEK